MTPNNRSYLIDKLVRVFDLNPVYDDNGQLLIGSKDVARVFDRPKIFFEIIDLKIRENNKEAIIYDYKEFSRPGIMDFHLNITALALLVKSYPGPIAKQFMEQFIKAVAQQNLLLNNDDFILFRASQILLERADKKTRKLIG